MKLFLLALAVAVVPGSLVAIELGDTYEKIVDERGVPVNKMEVNGAATLNYVESTIKLRDGRIVAIRMAGVETGDSYEKVVEKKGAPASKIETGVSSVLRYADATIKLREGKVVSIKMAGSGEVVVMETTPAPTPSTTKGAGEWTTDYVAALVQAKAEKKKVLLFFTGSDWCGWCMRLDKEILSTADFKAYARGELVLVKLDFPRSTPQSQQVKARNQKLSQQYKIKGYPTIIVLNNVGRAVGTLGYQEGGPGPFIKALKGF